MIIRLAQLEDADKISELWVGLVQYHYELDSAMPVTSASGKERYATRIRNRLSDPLTRVLVAEVEGEVVAYVLALIVELYPDLFEQDKSGYIADIFVEKDFRDQGIAKQFVQALEAWFSENEVTYYEWSVAELNERSKSFWNAIGGRVFMNRMRKEI